MSKHSLGQKLDDATTSPAKEFFPGMTLGKDQVGLVGDMKLGDEKDVTMRIRMTSISERDGEDKSVGIDFLSMETPDTPKETASKLFPNQGKK